MNPEQKTIETEKLSRPNLLIDFEACFEAVVAIEATVDSRIGIKERSIIRQEMLRALGLVKQTKEYCGFQGLGGFNRYDVRPDGTIALAQSHAFSESIKKAQELGVETPPYLGM